jgi:hypothetical protein
MRNGRHRSKRLPVHAPWVFDTPGNAPHDDQVACTMYLREVLSVGQVHQLKTEE